MVMYLWMTSASASSVEECITSSVAAAWVFGLTEVEARDIERVTCIPTSTILGLFVLGDDCLEEDLLLLSDIFASNVDVDDECWMLLLLVASGVSDSSSIWPRP